jgi:hypothetical protein
MPRPSRYPDRIGVAVSEETKLAIDAWRARQPGVPSRPEAVRRLLEQALKAEAAKC